MSQNSAHPMEAMMAFWKDAFARGGAAAAAAPTAGLGAGHSGSPTGDPLGWMPTPEQVRRMQASFLDALSQASDQYMRSPQFLESMKASLDSGLQMRRQMEEHMRRQMAEALGTPGQSSADVLAALHELESRLTAKIDELAARLDAVAGAEASASSTSTARESDGGTRPRRSTKG